MVIYLTTQILFFNVAYAMNAISETRVWRIGIALIFILSFNITQIFVFLIIELTSPSEFMSHRYIVPSLLAGLFM